MGAATAKLFADQGAKVAALDINTASVAAVVDEIIAAGKTAHAWTLDLSDRDAIGQVIGDIAAHFGGIDLLINNAGISVPAPIDGDGYEEAWATSLSVLLTAQHRTIRAALVHLRQSSNPRIVNIASTERYAEPEEVAHGSLNFCLPSSSFMTGTALPVDGGLTIKNA